VERGEREGTGEKEQTAVDLENYQRENRVCDVKIQNFIKSKREIIIIIVKKF